MADGHSRMPTLMPGTHCQNICDNLLQLPFSSAHSRRFYSSRCRVQRIKDIFLFNGLYKFTYLLACLLCATYIQQGGHHVGHRPTFHILCLFMVALCNRETIYIFILFLSSSFFFFFFFPRLISAVGDWMFTILWHMVWP